MMMRMDFTADNKEWSFLYDDKAYSDNEAKEIIKRCASEYFDNACLKDNARCFFLPTSKADLLREMVQQRVDKAARDFCDRALNLEVDSDLGFEEAIKYTREVMRMDE